MRTALCRQLSRDPGRCAAPAEAEEAQEAQAAPAQGLQPQAAAGPGAVAAPPRTLLLQAQEAPPQRGDEGHAGRTVGAERPLVSTLRPAPILLTADRALQLHVFVPAALLL